MRRIPVLATLVVVLAVGLMISLGLWQLRRAEWKEALLARYAVAPSLPPVTYPQSLVPDERLLFRRATGFCVAPESWTVRAGHNRAGESGWRHIALCRTRGDADDMAVDLGWSNRSEPPHGYKGGPVSGTLDWDRDHVFVLVSDHAASGLKLSAKPSAADIPNNHRAYAVQWFLFAGVALVIYVLALRLRMRRP